MRDAWVGPLELELSVGREVFCMCENFKKEKQEIHECVPFVSLLGNNSCLRSCKMIIGDGKIASTCGHSKPFC